MNVVFFIDELALSPLRPVSINRLSAFFCPLVNLLIALFDNSKRKLLETVSNIYLLCRTTWTPPPPALPPAAAPATWGGTSPTVGLNLLFANSTDRLLGVFRSLPFSTTQCTLCDSFTWNTLHARSALPGPILNPMHNHCAAILLIVLSLQLDVGIKHGHHIISYLLYG